jgi:hypothetical protein
MNKLEIAEKEPHLENGIAALLLNILGLILSVIMMISGTAADRPRGRRRHPSPDRRVTADGFLLHSVWGLKTVRPNEALVLTLFGTYYGTIRKQGFFFVNPFCSAVNPGFETARADAMEKMRAGEDPRKTNTGKVSLRKTVSLKTMTLMNGTQKVNDVLGNPIIIGTVVLWCVSDPTTAVFKVENYSDYLSTQTDSTIRNIARLYPYDDFSTEEGESEEKTLRGSAQEIALRMKDELQERVSGAGLTMRTSVSLICRTPRDRGGYAPAPAGGCHHRRKAKNRGRRGGYG